MFRKRLEQIKAEATEKLGQVKSGAAERLEQVKAGASERLEQMKVDAAESLEHMQSGTVEPLDDVSLEVSPLDKPVKTKKVKTPKIPKAPKTQKQKVAKKPKRVREEMSVKKFSLFMTYFSIITLFIIGCFYILVDKDAISKQVFEVIRKETGYKTRAEYVSFTLFPLPSVVMNNVYVENDSRSTFANILEVQEVTFRLSFSSLFKGLKGGLYAVELHKPLLLLEKYTDEGTNWAFIKKYGADKARDLPVSHIVIEDGGIKRSDYITNDESSYDHINVSISKGLLGGLKLSGDVSIGKVKNKFSGEIDVEEQVEHKGVRFKPDMSWSDAYGKATYKGALDLVDGEWIWNGDFAMSSADIMPWIKVFLNQKDQEMLGSVVEVKQPLEIQFALLGDRKQQQFKDIKVKMLAGEGVGQVAVIRQRDPHLKMYWDFKEFNFFKLLPGASEGDFSSVALEYVLGRMLVPSYEAEVNLHVGKFIAIPERVFDLKMAGVIRNAELQVTNMHVAADNNLAFDLNGKISKDAAERVIYEGDVFSRGDRFLDFIKGNGLELLGLMVRENGKFGMGLHISLARDQTIISNVYVDTSDVHITGGLNINNLANTEIKGTLSIAGGKIDKLFSTTLETARAKDRGAYDVIPIAFPWLRNIGGAYNLNITLKDYSFADVVQGESVFNMRISKDKLEMSDVDLTLANVRLKGNLKYNQETTRPNVEAKLDISSLDFQYVEGKQARVKPVPRGNHQNIWSKDIFDYKLYQGFDAEVELRVRKIYHNLFTLDSVSAIILAKDDVWQLKEMQGAVWGGVMQAQGQLSLGTIPAISAAFSVQNIPSERFLNSFFGLDGMQGPMSITGQVMASGLNLDGWMSNNSGTLTLAAYNNTMKGFDLPALVKLVPRVTSVEEIRTLAPKYLLVNKSKLDTVAGTMSLSNGVLTSDNIKLRTRDAVGDVLLNVDLKSWIMDAVVKFKLLTVSRGDYPSVSVLFKDSMDDPQVDLYLRELEAFMARRGTAQ